ncbi:MAG: hypothetical protein J6J60_02990, partial [Clostridia bacterium]|nr:hypothetical protein [Clostridia bacterium]
QLQKWHKEVFQEAKSFYTFLSLTTKKLKNQIGTVWIESVEKTHLSPHRPSVCLCLPLAEIQSPRQIEIHFSNIINILNIFLQIV